MIGEATGTGTGIIGIEKIADKPFEYGKIRLGRNNTVGCFKIKTTGTIRFNF
jgi:hypothetical protein